MECLDEILQQAVITEERFRANKATKAIHLNFLFI